MLYFKVLILMNTILGAFKYMLKGTNGIAALIAMAIISCIVLLMSVGFACLIAVLISGTVDTMDIRLPIISTSVITAFEWLSDGKEDK